MNKKKCKFFKTEITILGNIVGHRTVRPDSAKVEALNNYSRPNTIRELRAFLGLANYCRGFIPNLARLEGPLNKKLKGETKRSVKTIVWDKEASTAFQEIKKQLSETTMRTQPDFSKEFILTTDASEHAYGAILSQINENGEERMIYAYSRTMDETQRNYSVTDKELLAIIKATEHFRRYLLGREFLLKTDHKALTYLMETKNPTSRLLRWSLRLQEFRFRIEYVKREENGADALSRHCNEEKETSTINIISEKAFRYRKY